MALVSVYEAVDYESNTHLKQYKKLLKRINKIGPMLEDLSDDELKELVPNPVDIKNKKHKVMVYAIAREVTYRLLGKKHYDVQVLGGLAALERNMIQMRTGSGKTITLILPAVFYGLMHKGCHVLTVNDYLSQRDWKETKPVYDWFGLTSAYTSMDHSEIQQREAFDCDITYCTNSTLGFAYLHSSLANEYDGSVKPIARPLAVAIIDEADEILMDDAQNPLIIAQSVDMGSELSTVDYYGATYHISDIVEQLKYLRHMKYTEEDGSIQIDDSTYNEIINMLGLDDRLFQHHRMMFVIYNAIQAIYHQKVMRDYIVADQPDPDSGSRIILIDKATGRLAKGRTLNDQLHSFVEMKENVFSGVASESTLQVTYQMLFNIYPQIAGVTGTLGTSFAEFTNIYQTGLVVVPDRVPNRLQSFTHLYPSKHLAQEDMLRHIRMYMSSAHPVLIGVSSDTEVYIVSDVLTHAGIPHKTLVSTDTNEEYIVEKAGLPGSVVVTTDIMGRGTDIHVDDHNERGLVVLQLGIRVNSRIERQLAGRAGRQGKPGRYHRFLALPEMKEIQMTENTLSELYQMARTQRDTAERYHHDIFNGGTNELYQEWVEKIDYFLHVSESQSSQYRTQSYMTSQIVDEIQVGLVAELDSCRQALGQYRKTGQAEEMLWCAASLTVPMSHRHSKRHVKKMVKQLASVNPEQIFSVVASYIPFITQRFLPQFRKDAESMLSTVNLGSAVNHDSAPENHMAKLIGEYLREHESQLTLDKGRFGIV